MEDPTVFVRTMPNVYYRHTTGDTTPDMKNPQTIRQPEDGDSRHGRKERSF
ncbi:MAG: hypothetical protein QHG97_00345 [Methanolinea sp.]|jgi:hypothetical protein|nr:hypothetical protein [Methanolinea sp.]